MRGIGISTTRMGTEDKRMNRMQKVTAVLLCFGLVALLLLLCVSFPLSVAVGSPEGYPYVTVVEFRGVELTGQAELEGEQAQTVIAVLEDTKVKFVRKGEGFAYDSSIPRYDISLTGDGAVLGTIRVNGTYLHYNDWHYALSEDAAAKLNEVLASCFS